VLLAICAPSAGAAPKLSVNDPIVTELDSPATNEAVFEVTLSKKAKRTVKADYITGPESASAGSDFDGIKGTLKIKKGKKKTSLPVTVNGDDEFEEDETFNLVLSNPRRAQIDDGFGQATIQNNDIDPDSDGDGIGDSVDPCPDYPDPGGYCLLRPYDAQNGRKAIIEDLIVTAVTADETKVWAAWQAGDPGYDSGHGSAVIVDLTELASPPALTVGERIDIKGAWSTGPTFAPISITQTNDIDTPVVTEYESNDVSLLPNNVLIRLDAPPAQPPTNFPGFALDHKLSDGTWVFQDGTEPIQPGRQVGDEILGSLPNQVDGHTYGSVTGISTQILGGWKVMPRTVEDIDSLGPEVLSFTMSQDCTALGGDDVSVGTITLDEPAESSGPFEGLGTNNPSVVTASATLTAGSSTVPVTVDALGVGLTQLTAAGTFSVLSGMYRAIEVGNPCQNKHLVINEVDYDQVGVDTGEFIEVLNTGSVPVDLSSTYVGLFSKAPPTAPFAGEYAAFPLGSGTLAPGAFIVLANSGVTVPGGVTTISLPNNTIQNGSSDGIALLETGTQRVWDALSYENTSASGAITLARPNQVAWSGHIDLTEGGAPTPASADDDAATPAGSMARTPNGTDTDVPASDWANDPTPSPGAAN
jgi:hypothetical protein